MVVVVVETFIIYIFVAAAITDTKVSIFWRVG